MHFLSVFALLLLSINLSRGDFQTEAFNLRLAGTRMSSGIVKIIPQVSLIKCAIMCAQDPSQIAFNYNAEERNCELITKQQDALSTSLEKDDYYNYYIINSFLPCQAKCEGRVCFANSDGISHECRSVEFVMPEENDHVNQNDVDPCEPNPCLQGGVCSANSDGIKYECSGATTSKSDISTETIQSKNDPCESNPCQMGSECSATPDGMDYQCLNCVYPGIVKDCYEFVCGTDDHCFHTEDTFYLLQSGSGKPQVSWEDTFTACSGFGLEMATMKNDSNEKYLMDTLTATVGFMNMATYRFWLGLKRECANTEWKWADGSALGEYQPWVDKEPGEKDLYVSFTVTVNTGLQWNGETNAPYEDDMWLSANKYPTFCQAQISTSPVPV